jgi:hypothetical protein
VPKPVYQDDKGHRAVVLVDDQFVRDGEQQGEDQASLSIVGRVVKALLDAGLIVHLADTTQTVKKFIIASPDSPASVEPAPSAWVLDIDLPLGANRFARDGIDLAAKIRSENDGASVLVPSPQGTYVPIPILFLTRFHLKDILQGDSITILDRIRSEVQMGWRFFRKNLEGSGALIVEEFESGPARPYGSAEEFAKEVKKVIGVRP